MKNIHLLPTDKPSKLLYNHTLKSFCFQKKENGMFVNDGKVSGASFWSIEKAQHNGFCPQHIYITNSEEIKEGDWYENNGVIFKADDVFDKGNNPNNSNPKVTDFNIKIILTTDQDLIKDGVQAIDDEFLEWFVKNPSCEEVETKLVEFEVDMELGDSCIEYGSYYEIIIPKEETTAYHYLSCCRSIEECHCGKYPKQIKCYCGHTTMCDCSPIDEPKQETLEEVELAILFHNTYEKLAPSFGYETREDTKYFDITTPNGKLMIAVCKEIIKWQQERMYSEEEVRNLFRNYQYDSAQFAAIMEGDTDGKPTPTGWFEKFKKK